MTTYFLEAIYDTSLPLLAAGAKLTAQDKAIRVP